MALAIGYWALKSQNDKHINSKLKTISSKIIILRLGVSLSVAICLIKNFDEKFKKSLFTRRYYRSGSSL